MGYIIVHSHNNVEWVDEHKPLTREEIYRILDTGKAISRAFPVDGSILYSTYDFHAFNAESKTKRKIISNSITQEPLPVPAIISGPFNKEKGFLEPLKLTEEILDKVKASLSSKSSSLDAITSHVVVKDSMSLTTWKPLRR